MQACFLGDWMACRIGLLIAFLAVALASFASEAQAGAEVGIWLTQAGDAKVRISNCGGGGICGVVVWLKDPIDPATGKLQIDDKNPDPALAKRRTLAFRCLSACAPQVRTNGRARSTMPMTARAMPATFRCRVRAR